MTRGKRHLGRLLYLWLIVGLMAWSGAVAYSATPHTYVEVIHYPELAKAADIAVGRPGGVGGAWQLASVREDHVRLYGWEEGAQSAQAELRGFPIAPASLAYADYDGDGHDDLWVGTAYPGNIYVYGLTKGFPFLGQANRRTWAKIDRVIPADLDGDQFADVVVLTENGGVFAYLRREQGLVQVWDSGPRAGRVQHVLTCDVDGDKRQEIVIAREGYVAAWRWVPEPTAVQPAELDPAGTPWPVPELASTLGVSPKAVADETPEPASPQPARAVGRFTNILEFDTPWGLISAVVATDIERDGKMDVLVTTTQNLVYVFSTGISGQFQTKYLNPPEAPAVAAGLRGAINTAGQNLLVGAVDGGIVFWQPRPVTAGLQFDSAWQSDFSIQFNRITAAGDYLLATGADGVHVFRQAPADYIKVWVRGEPSPPLQAAPIFVRNDVMLAAKDWVNLLELASPSWNQAQGRLSLFKGLQHLVVALGSRDVIANGQRLSLEYEPINRDGLVFLPTQALKYIHNTISWQPRSRVLTIQ